jgi:hypothetical protein
MTPWKHSDSTVSVPVFVQYLISFRSRMWWSTVICLIFATVLISLML